MGTPDPAQGSRWAALSGVVLDLDFREMRLRPITWM
jgi:hypothetical protein